MLGSLILYIKGMRILMFQLSGFYCVALEAVRPEACTRGSGTPCPRNTARQLLSGAKGARATSPPNHLSDWELAV